MIKYILFFSLGILTIYACQEDGMKKTTTGYEYQVHRNEPGDAAKTGDHAFFIAELYSGDSLVHSSRQTPLGREHVEIREVPQQYSYFRPMMEMLTILSPGDSASLWYPVDSFPSTPAGLENTDMVRYAITMEEIIDSVAYEAYVEEQRASQMAEMEDIKAREAEVASFVNQVYSDYKAGKLDSEIQTTESGLKYVIHEEGTGAQASNGKQISAHYYGMLESDASMFDNSFSRGQPLQFQLGAGKVIPGWDEGFALLKEGAKATLFIPYELAYGKAGYPPDIPEEANLIFYVELDKIL